MEADVSPLEDEPEDLKGMETRVELIHYYWLAFNDGLVNAEAIFENVITQLRTPNPVVALRTEGCNFSYIVVD